MLCPNGLVVSPIRWNYKGIDFSFMFQFNYGNDIYNATRLYATQSRSSRRNMLAEVADRWSPTNASNLVPSYDGYITNDVYSRFVEDGSFLRLKEYHLRLYIASEMDKQSSMYPSCVFMLLVRICSAGTIIADMTLK